jgi:GNAT superfamily N-acetyltransferase
MQDPAPDRPPSPRITVTDQPSDAALARILDGLVAFNASLVGPSDRRMLAVLVSTEDDRPQGGLSGFTAWGWLFIEKVWLADELRGQGLAGRLLAEAETEALRRGCHGAWLDTFNPAAQVIYERQGYRVFGELQDFPTGRSRVFLQKPLGPAAGQSAVPLTRD